MVNQLYHTWIRQMRQLLPQERITRLRNLVWLMLGIYQSKTAHLSKVALKISGKEETLSLERRLRRFVDNPAVKVRAWYQAVALSWLAGQGATTGGVRLIFDGTKIGHGYQLVMVALAFQRRAIPIDWLWVKHKKGKGRTTNEQQLELLRRVYDLLPNHLPVLLVGDSEFGTAEILEQLDAWGWQYVLRQKGVTKFQEQPAGVWRNLRDLLGKAGQWRWLENVSLTESHPYTTHLLAYWQPGEEEPWLLATNFTEPQLALRAYRRRAWIEEMFGDWKGHGFDVEATRLRDAERLSRLILAVALLFNWLVALGVRIRQRRLAHWIDRSDRFDLSIFQTGLRWVERALTNHHAVDVLLCPS